MSEQLRDAGRLAVIGVGVMGEALLAAALRAGWDPAQVHGTVDPSVPVTRMDELIERYGVQISTDNRAAVREAATVIVAVKPGSVVEVLAQLSPELASGTLIVSVAGGITLETYERALPAGTGVVRVMPNTPALIGAGVSGMSLGSAVSAAQAERARALLAQTGLVIEVPEHLQNAVTAISGSGPAYVFYLVDALAEAGVGLGLSRDQALQLAIGTFAGSAQLLQETGEHPVVLRERVTSPGGTTAAGLAKLDEGSVRFDIIAAARATAARAAEMGS